MSFDGSDSGSAPLPTLAFSADEVSAMRMALGTQLEELRKVPADTLRMLSTKDRRMFDAFQLATRRAHAKLDALGRMTPWSKSSGSPSSMAS